MLTQHICEWIFRKKCNEWIGKTFQIIICEFMEFHGYTHFHTYKYEIDWLVHSYVYGKLCFCILENVLYMMLLFVSGKCSCYVYLVCWKLKLCCSTTFSTALPPGSHFFWVLLKWEFNSIHVYIFKHQHVLSKMLSEYSISCSNKMFQLFWYLSMSWNRKRKFFTFFLAE